ncbi:MAG: type II and III secretion system protein family protein [Motiliproteus sp.]
MPAMLRLYRALSLTLIILPLVLAADRVFGESGVTTPTIKNTMMAPLSGDALSGDAQQQRLTIPVNKSRVIKLAKKVGRVSVANPKVADILVISPQQIYLVGKQLGTTNVVVWDKKKRVQRIIDLQVTHDLAGLKERLFRFLPGEMIRVESAQQSIVLSGEVSSPQKMGAALDLAKTFVGSSNEAAADKSSKVLNLMQIGGAQQVLLEVKVAEISRSLVRKLDVDFNIFSAKSPWKLGAVNGGARFPDAVIKDSVLGEGRIPQFFDRGVWGPALPEFAPNESQIANTGAFLQYLSGDFLLEMVIDAAKNQGLAKVLAEPNLTTLSGQEARFISGGEFPIPVPGKDGGITIKFKEFGVGLVFVPIVLDSGLISLKVNVTVSELKTDDSSLVIGFAQGVSSTNFFVPALTKRAANATVEVPDGQTIAIAGLINENLRENVEKMPWLGDLPILGSLFRSQEFVKGQSELIIFVTPRLATAFDPDLIKLPTDDFVEPSDTEFYLMGLMEGRSPSLGPDKTGAEGKFGHEL